MRTVIFAGGKGTRLAEHTSTRPKPLVEVGGIPMLQHIIDYYAGFNVNEFVVATGYLGEMIKRYFVDDVSLCGDLTIDFSSGAVKQSRQNKRPYSVVCADTGVETQTGSRLKRCASFVPGDGPFFLTYGDGLCDVDLDALLAFHRAHGKLATVTAVHPPARFGEMDLDDKDLVAAFAEKPQVRQGWINGGFMVLEPEVFARIPDGDDCVFETGVLAPLAKDEQLMAYRHEGFWQCMDTLRDLRTLESLWDSGDPPWRT